MARPSIYVFEDSQVDRLYPLTFSRAAFELRAGTLTLLERLRKNLGHPVAGLLVRSALAELIRRRVSDVPVNPALSAKEGIVLAKVGQILHLIVVIVMRVRRGIGSCD